MNQHRPACWDWTLPDQTLEPTLDLLLEWQAGRCGFCGMYISSTRSREFVLDHDHGTHLVRGFLCHTCNVGEGKRNSIKFDLYRSKPPAQIIGLTLKYDTKSTDEVQFNVRLPYSLLKTLEHYAAETSRSKNKSAIYLIQQALKNEGYI